MVNWRDSNGICCIDIKQHAEKTVDRIFPLLNPDLKLEERHKQHMTWYEDTPAMQTGNKALYDEKFKTEGTPEEWGERAPCVMPYIPSKKVFAKLIRFATLVENALIEFNPKECKTDPEEPLPEGADRDTPLGIDPQFNNLRVLVPPVLTEIYPDVERDGPYFYDKIKCLKLKKKYCPESIDDGLASEIIPSTMQELIET